MNFCEKVSAAVFDSVNLEVISGGTASLSRSFGNSSQNLIFDDWDGSRVVS